MCLAPRSLSSSPTELGFSGEPRWLVMLLTFRIPIAHATRNNAPILRQTLSSRPPSYRYLHMGSQRKRNLPRSEPRFRRYPCAKFSPPNRRPRYVTPYGLPAAHSLTLFFELFSQFSRTVHDTLNLQLLSPMHGPFSPSGICMSLRVAVSLMQPARPVHNIVCV